MDMRQEMTPEMQIYLIGSDVDEIKAIVTKLEGTVSQIHISLVSTDEKPGVFEQLRALAKHKHPEIDRLRGEIRWYSGAVAGAIFVLEIVLRNWPGAKP